MTDTQYKDPTVLQRVALAQENPREFYEKLKEVRDNKSDTPEALRRFELKLELDSADMNAALKEVAVAIGVDDQ